jgi:lambda repressor-like predicted transcriptional regulator
MPAAPAASTPRDADRRGGPRRWLASAAIGTFTILVAAICIILLSSTLTQTRLTGLAIDGVGIGIRKLDNIGQQWAQLRRQRDDQQSALAASELKRLPFVGPKAAFDKAFATSRAETEAALAGFYHRIKAAQPDLVKLASLIHQRSHDDQVGIIRGAKDQLRKDHPELEDAIKSIEAGYEAQRRARQRRAEVDAQIAGPEEEIKLHSAAIAATEKKLDRLFDLIKAKLEDADRLKVENAFYELNLHKSVVTADPSQPWYSRLGTSIVGGFATVLRGLLTMQPDLLTLFLVIFMGVLGSALQISHAYFMKNQVQTIGGFFQRISVGAMTALVIFIVAKAGVPVLADPSRLAGDAPINPYFISFLAIISGLLSENAIANIQAQGARLFGGGAAGPNRWTRGDLTGELEKKGVTIDDLAGYLGIDKETATDLLKGKKAIEPAQQKLITVALRMDPREIYTDIAPA